jgi:beta-lactam-binding protein with PASTA domain
VKQFVDNRYRIVQPLGNGGMAEVYLAHDDILDRDVALKVMSGRYAGDDEFVERFKREAQSAAALSHPNIVSIFDRGASEDGTYYIAMEYLPGGTLKDRITKRGALPPRTAAAVALQIAEALCAAHERGVIHRDIKPHNILITESGDVKVTDFGIARAASSSTMTRTGSILGTAHYISPEQAMGEPVGPASDLYSLGVVLYEMLTGELPFDAETPLGIAMKHVSGYLRPPKEVNPQVPEGINAITVRLLAKDPLDRYTSDAELIEDLERFLAGLEPSDATTEMMTRVMPPAAATKVGPPPPPTKVSRSVGKRRRGLPMILALLSLLLLAPLAWAGYDFLQDEQVPQIKVPNLVGMTLEEARDEVGKDLDITVEDEVRDEKPVDTILSQNPEGGKAEKGSKISVTVVGTRVANVPGTVGQDREEAVATLEDAGFEVRVEEVESSFEKEGLVTGQDPGGGTTEEVGSEVKITVGTGPSTVEVPDLTGNSPAQAAAILQQAGLALGAQTEVYGDAATEGTVVYQDPVAGVQVEPGSSVGISVSIGPEPVTVPEVYGMTLAAAKQAVANAGLYWQVYEIEGEEPAGTALSTDPRAGTQLDPGSNVVIYYSSGPPPEPTPQPTAEAQPNPADDAAARERDRQQQQEDRANRPENRNRGGEGGGEGGGGGRNGRDNSGNE